MKSKFDFNEIVKIVSVKQSLIKYNGFLGIIRGKSQSESNPDLFAYSVDILNKEGEVVACKFIFEDDLEVTGKMASKHKLYAGKSVRVRVNPKTGEGEIVEDEN